MKNDEDAIKHVIKLRNSLVFIHGDTYICIMFNKRNIFQ